MTNASLAPGLDVLDLWHKVEFFLPFDLQAQVVEEADAHWALRLWPSAGLAIAQAADLWSGTVVPDGKELSGFEVYLGLFDASLMSEEIDLVLGAPGSDAERSAQEERSDIEGDTCFARIRVSADGVAGLEEISVSTVPWALGQLARAGLGGLDIDTFELALRGLKERLRNFRLAHGPDSGLAQAPAWSGADLLRLLALLQDWAGFQAPDEGRAVVAVRARARKPSTPQAASAAQRADEDDAPEVEVDILNSFYAKDLQRVMQAMRGGAVGTALQAYLKLGGPAGRTDLYTAAGRRRTLEGLHPGLWPAAHWFSAPHLRMSLMQQFAINSLFGQLAEPGLFAVNGPPGTGKTTMLREIFAENLVRRARALAACREAADAFAGSPLQVNFEGNAASCKVSRLRPELTGYEMVVASSNNAAVENISHDLPKSSALGKTGESPWRQADGGPAAGYLRPVAHRIAAENSKGEFDALPPDEAPWGLIAAALGRRANRRRFGERLFFLPRPKDESRPVKGLDPALHQTFWQWRDQYAGPGFAEARFRFEQAEARVARRMAALAAMVDLSRERGAGDAAAYCRAQQDAAAEASARHLDAQATCALLAGQAAHTEAVLADLREQEHLLHRTRPAWWKRWLRLRLARIHASRLLDNLHAQHDAVGARRTAQDLLRKAHEALRAAAAADEQAGRELSQKMSRWDCLQRQWAQAMASFPEARAPLDADDIEHAAWQVEGVWADAELNRLRCELFAAALGLHEAWLAEASRSGGGFGPNLVAASHLLSGKRLSNPEHALAIWQSLFMVVPVVSSTFASMASQFRELGAGALGWLFIDEAGQAVPQAAVGALWRCQRAVVVGDPRQIQPVFTVPFRLVEELARQAGLPADTPFLPHKTSVQELADAASRDGAWAMLDGDRRLWIGSPLRVHRRCVRKIFDLANAIAYEGKMVYGLGADEPPSGTLDLGGSAWVQVEGEAEFKQVVEAQLDCVLAALARLTLSQGRLPPLYIISPFKAVKAALRERLADPVRWQGYIPSGQRFPFSKSALKAWCRERIGTVHTFQGKEQSIVWIVLGCSMSRAGGAAWASDQPNVLNVALTRAQHRVFVIGDLAVWAGRRYFSTVAAALPVLDSSGFLDRMRPPRPGS